MSTCKYCGKPLTLTPEYDFCMECQGLIMRESKIPQGVFAANSTQQMITHEEARSTMMKFEAHDIYDGDFVNELKDMANYITQQEKKEERAKKVEELLKTYEVLVHDYEQLLETKDSKEWSLLRFHSIELKRIIDEKLEELK